MRPPPVPVVASTEQEGRGLALRLLRVQRVPVRPALGELVHAVEALPYTHTTRQAHRLRRARADRGCLRLGSSLPLGCTADPREPGLITLETRQ